MKLLENINGNKPLNRILFIFLCTFLFFYFSYNKTIFLRPQSQHQWRQCDGSSFALMYFHEHNALFFPKTHNLNGENGNTIGEFPIIYYLDGLLYRIFGYHECIIKIVNYLFFLFGLWYLNLLLFRYTKNNLLACLVVAIAATFPLVAYYAVTSLPNVPAFSFSIAAIYYLLVYADDKKRINFIWSVLFFSCVALLKPTTLVLFLSINSILLINNFYKEKLQSFTTKMQQYLFLIVPLLMLVGWLCWTKIYVKQYHAEPFLLSIKPIWEKIDQSRSEIWNRIHYDWWNVMMYKPILWITCAMAAFTLFSKINRTLKSILILCVLANFAYFILFFNQFYHHDYYLLEFIWLIIWIIVASSILINNNKNKYLRYSFYVLLLFMAFKNGLNAKEILTARYAETYKWDDFYNDFFDIKPELVKKGMVYTDKVVVAEDKSFAISLYLMDQIGWTEIYEPVTFDKLMQYKNLGAKYFICKQDYFNQHEEYKTLTNQLFLKHKSILIFKL